MSERRDENFGCLEMFIVILLAGALMAILTQQISYVRDLQRRVGQLEESNKR